MKTAGPSVLCLAILLLAGCAEKGGPTTTSQAPGPVDDAPLRGWVFDPAVAPVVGATVTVHGTNNTTATAGDGSYRFETLPLETPLVIIVEAAGFVTASKSVTIPEDVTMMLNFTMEPVPVKEAYVDVFPISGFLSCQVVVIAADQSNHFDCGAPDSTNDPMEEFTVGPDVAGMVFELEWQPGTAAAEELNVTVETVGFGDQDTILTANVGPSVLRAQVSESAARRYYSEGGIVRAIVGAGAEPDASEQSVGASGPVQQEFTLYVSVFYVEPPAPTYSALNPE